MVEDITAWWNHEASEEDEKLVCEDNLSWLDSIDWYVRLGWDYDWEKKWAIEAAQVRLWITQCLRKAQGC